MAADAQEKAPVARGSATGGAAKIIGDISLYYPVLVECELERSETLQATDQDKPEHFYDAALQSVMDKSEQSLSVAICAFTAGQKLKDRKLVELKATYYVAMRCEARQLPEAEVKNLLSQMATSSAWAQFRTLFAHVAAQTGLDLPALQPVAKMRWLELAETRKKKKSKRK